MFKLFPGTDHLDPRDRFSNPLDGGKTYWTPGRDRRLALDKQEEEEKIYVVASRSRNARLRHLYKHLEETRRDRDESRKGTEINAKMKELLGMEVSKNVRRKAEAFSRESAVREKGRPLEEFSHAI